MNSQTGIRNVGWSIGTYCNATCKHCYSLPIRSTQNNLTKKEVEIILEKLVSLKVQTLNIGGNEPIFTNGGNIQETLLPYILQQASAAGIAAGITTNGLTAEYLLNHNRDILPLVNDWDFSLDSPIEEEHNRNRGVNLFKLLTKTLNTFYELGFHYSLVVCAMNWNTSAAHARKLFELASTYHAEVRINLLKPVVPQHFALMPTQKQIYDFFNEIDRLATHLTIDEPVFAAIAHNDKAGCSCGIQSMSIHPKTENGEIPVSPCVFLRDFEIQNVLCQDEHQIVMTPQFQKFRNRNRFLPRACLQMDCEWLETCRGGCTARTWLVYKDLDYPDPLCPKLAQNQGLILPPFTNQALRQNDLRVHEGYLCTWIGKPK